MHPLDPFVLTREQCREVDRYAIDVLGIPGAVLMENAGRNAAEVIAGRLRSIPQARCAIVCGKGNNGGDGFVVARHLLRHGCEVRVYLAAPADALLGDAALNYRPLERLGIPCTQITEQPAIERAAAEWRQCDVLVDGLLGTGFEGQVREPIVRIIEHINALSGPTVVALDVPSGLDANTGQPGGVAVRAHQTITFVAAKPGLLLPDARAFVGELTVADIGIPLNAILDRIA